MKAKLTAISFALILVIFMALVPLLPDKSVSVSERRTLAAFPKLTWAGIFGASASADDGAWMDAVEKYMPDQFPARDAFRQAALVFRLKLMNERSYKGVTVYCGSAFEPVYPLDTASTVRFTQKLTALKEAYFPENRVWLAMIPDKACYIADGAGVPNVSYADMESAVLETLADDIAYIPLYDALSADDYFATDIHWRQDRLDGVMQTLSAAMDRGFVGEYAYRTVAPFYGSYYSRTVGLDADSITYLESDIINGATVVDVEKGDIPVYNEDALYGTDGYDLFMGGASPVVTVTAANAPSSGTKKLIVFRDSFGSSIAPLLLAGYDTVTLVDLRYISSSLLGEYVDFDDADVLFLYGMRIVNSSMLLK